MLPIREYIYHPRLLLLVLLEHFGTWLPDALYIKAQFYLRMGYPLNLKEPRSFCEKIQWLKLFYRVPLFTTLVDKVSAKEYVSKLITSDHIIPTIRVFNSINEIDWDILPNKFVMKTTHGGGSSGVVICRDKSSLNKEDTCKKLASSMKQDIYKLLKEWPYKNVQRRIMVEKYIDNGGNDLIDYKWYCFNGEPVFCQVIKDRSSQETIDFFDASWKHMDFVGLNPRVTNAREIPCRPEKLELQKLIARKLSANLPFLRVDLYEVNGNVYFGELTLYPSSGFGRFEPPEYDYHLGMLLDLPSKSI